MPDPEKPKIISATLASGGYAVTGFEAKFLIHAPLPADHEFYALIGRVTSEWAHLEHALDLIIWDLADVPQPIGACITAQIMGASNRYNTIIALATARGRTEAKIEKVESAMRKIFSIQEERNRIIHDPWYIEKVTGQPGQFKSMPKKDLRYGHADVEKRQVEDLIKRISDRTNDARNLWNIIVPPDA